MFENISVTGITPLDYYPRKDCLLSCKEFSTTDTVYIPCEKPRIESINEIKVCICVDEYRLVDTILGPKVIVSGRKKFKVIYTALNREQSVHSAHWEIPFYEFILIKDMCYQKCKKMLCSVFVGVEDVCTNFYNKNCIELNSLFIICPKISECIVSCNDNCECNLKSNCKPEHDCSYNHNKYRYYSDCNYDCECDSDYYCKGEELENILKYKFNKGKRKR
ncbi:DUF3794 domain-containing protein [Clostridium perfringens]|nr:DUF3794 domain-containing protein [Clostridium perfringens]